MKRNVYALLILFLLLSVATTVADADENTFSKAQICRAGISTVMGKDPNIIKIDKIKDQIIYLFYIRPSDKKRWAYRCKLSGNRIIWASDTGRWRDSQYDSKITYKINGENIKIKDRFGDGSVTMKSFSLNQLK